MVSGSLHEDNQITLWYAQMPIVYKHRFFGCVMKWSTGGLCEKIILEEDPREDFLTESFGQDNGSGNGGKFFSFFSFFF